VARRVPLFEFAIRSVLGKHNLDTAEGQLAALDETAPIVGKIKDSGLRSRYAVNLDRWLGMMDERFVLARVKAHAGDGRGSEGRGGAGTSRDGRTGAGQAPQRTQAGAAREAPYDERDPIVQVEREVLKLAVQHPALCGPEFDALGSGAFTVTAHRGVFSLIAAGGGTSAGVGREWAARLIEEAPNDRARAFMTRLAVESLQIPGEPDAKYVDIVLARVGELAVSREIAAVKSRLQRMNPVTEQTEYNKMFGDMAALEQRRRTLIDRATGA
jgi:DNA primase